MNTPFRFLAIAVLTMLPVFADSVTVTVYPSVAPNVYGSPSWAGYLGNAMTSLETGPSAIGNPATDPTAYYRVNQITPNENVATDFASWLGMANPSGAFASELGNRLHFGMVIQGNGTQFSLSNLSFEMHSTDTNDMFGWVDSFNSSDVYSSTRVGYIIGTGFVTSGSATQLVDAFYYVGVGLAAPVSSSDPGATNQDKIDNMLAGAPLFDCGFPCGMPAAPYDITMTYSITDVTSAVTEGSATVSVVTAPIPEPGAIVLFATFLGLAAVFNARRRRTA